MNRFVREFAVASALGLLALSPLALQAQTKDDSKDKESLPLNKVVMFSSGVGFFEHTGEVTGDANVQLQFRVDDVNDLLKSMVVQDLGGGKVSTVSYASKDPITRTLQTFAIDLTRNPTLADLLTQVRGEKVEVYAPNPIQGIILGVETRRQQLGEKETIEVEYLNLLTEDGLRSVALPSVMRIRLLNEKLDAELRQALAILAMSHATDKKSVSLNFRGEGKRPVRVGYIQETPIWKTSYRLVLKDEGKPLIQGWAIVENTSEEDWKDVDLTLVSGRPISFVMDLYEPLYVDRPVVEPELFASLRPQTYGQDLASKDKEFLKKAEAGAAFAPGLANGRFDQQQRAAQSGEARESLSRRSLGDGKGSGFGGGMGGMGGAFDPSQGVQSMAQAADVGELFQYKIENPVTLPRQRSAMLPIVNGEVAAEKVSIYNQSVQAKHPLNGLQLTNSTGLHLMQGPITVFDDGAYAGDAQIQDLQPGTKRLISYALDLNTEVAPRGKPQTEDLTSVKLVKGVLITTRKYNRSQEYVIKNSGSKAKTVLIEYPKDATWTLIAPKEPKESTRDLYRFAVTAEPGKPVTLEVKEQRTGTQNVVLTNVDDNTILFYVNARVVSDEVKAALKEVIRRKQALSEIANQRRQLEQELKVIDQEQARIRQNMAQLDRNGDLYARYVKKFGEQEDAVEKLRSQIAKLQADEAQARKELDEYLIGLSIE